MGIVMLNRVLGLLATAGAGAVALALVSAEKAEALWLQPSSGAPAFQFGAWHVPGHPVEGAGGLRGSVGDAGDSANASTDVFPGRSRGAGGPLGVSNSSSGAAAATGQTGGSGGSFAAHGEFRGISNASQSTGAGQTSGAGGFSRGISGANQSTGAGQASGAGGFSKPLSTAGGDSGASQTAGSAGSWKTLGRPGSSSGVGQTSGASQSWTAPKWPTGGSSANQSSSVGGSWKGPSHPASGSTAGQSSGLGGSSKLTIQSSRAPTKGHTLGSGPTPNLQSSSDPPGIKPGDSVTYTSVGMGNTIQLYIVNPAADAGIYDVGQFQLQTTAYGTVLAFCVDLSTELNHSGGTYTAGRSADLTTTLGLTHTQIGEIGALLVHAQGLIGDATSTNTAPDIAAALQLAIWDVEYAPDFSFYAPAIVLSDYQTYLNDAQNVWAPYFNYVSLNEAGNQTLVALPEPSTWAMMSLGFAGLGFASWRAARTKAKAKVAA
jgi:hypothetical protein